MKFKAHDDALPETMVEAYDQMEHHKEKHDDDTPMKDLKHEYKKIIKARLDLIETSIAIIKDCMAKMHDLKHEEHD